MNKKPGAPKGNKNAYKHGFYCRDFTQIEAGDLESALREGLQDEIAMLRISLRRLFQLSKESKDLETSAKILSSLSHASSQLANLLRTHKMLTGQSSATEDAITTAISQIIVELVK
jgi:ABC-type transporter Mla subunit MlaD